MYLRSVVTRLIDRRIAKSLYITLLRPHRVISKWRQFMAMKMQHSGSASNEGPSRSHTMNRLKPCDISPCLKCCDLSKLRKNLDTAKNSAGVASSAPTVYKCRALSFIQSFFFTTVLTLISSPSPLPSGAPGLHQGRTGTACRRETLTAGQCPPCPFP